MSKQINAVDDTEDHEAAEPSTKSKRQTEKTVYARERYLNEELYPETDELLLEVVNYRRDAYHKFTKVVREQLRHVRENLKNTEVETPPKLPLNVDDFQHDVLDAANSKIGDKSVLQKPSNGRGRMKETVEVTKLLGIGK